MGTIVSLDVVEWCDLCELDASTFDFWCLEDGEPRCLDYCRECIEELDSGLGGWRDNHNSVGSWMINRLGPDSYHTAPYQQFMAGWRQAQDGIEYSRHNHYHSEGFALKDNDYSDCP